MTDYPFLVFFLSFFAPWLSTRAGAPIRKQRHHQREIREDSGIILGAADAARPDHRLQLRWPSTSTISGRATSISASCSIRGATNGSSARSTGAPRACRPSCGPPFSPRPRRAQRRRWPGNEIDVELRYTNIRLQSFGGTTTAVEGSADSQSASLWPAGARRR